MVRYKYKVFVFLVFSLFFWTCTKKSDLVLDLGYDYAPATIGKYVIYDVDSTVYDDFKKDTVYYKYRIKEKLEQTFTDDEGRLSIKLVRYIKLFNSSVTYDDIAWTVKDVWSYTKTSRALEAVEENIRFTKLIFPVKEDDRWDGNAKNTLGLCEYKYDYIDKTEVINGIRMDKVLMVIQKNDKNNVIHREYFVEKYAKGIGLVYREIKDLYSNTVIVNPNGGGIIPVEQRIQKGVIYKLTYISHGFE